MAARSAADSCAEVVGDESAPGIVFVHGTRMAAAYWHLQSTALCDRFFVVAVDLPGHGRRRATPFCHEEALDTICRGISLCKGGAAIVVGHSLGGFLTMDAAAQAPERCRGLVLVGCTADARGVRTWPYRLVARVVPLISEERLARWNDRLLRRAYPPEVIEPQIRAGYGFAAVPAAWRAVFGRDHAATLARYPGPVLFLNGARDRLFRSGERRFLRACPHARLRVLPGAAHLSNLDRPAAFTEAVREFAERTYGIGNPKGSGGRVGRADEVHTARPAGNFRSAE
jgi:pimeloyl-ACP methyl ester carboxylesterase